MIRKITPTLASRIHSSISSGIEGIARTVWDVCIVGSGPGGAVAAATLAQAGWRVLLIERGAFRPAEQLKFRLLDMPRLGRLDVTTSARVALHQGNVLGGGSIIWGAVAMMSPKFIFDEWAEVSEVTTIDADALAPHYAYVADISPPEKRAQNFGLIGGATPSNLKEDARCAELTSGGRHVRPDALPDTLPAAAARGCGQPPRDSLRLPHPRSTGRPSSVSDRSRA